MEGHLSEGGDLGPLVHGDLIWICRDTREKGSRLSFTNITHISSFSSHTNNTETHHSAFMPLPFPFIPVSMSWTCICAEECYRAQTHSPRAERGCGQGTLYPPDIYRFLFDLFGPRGAASCSTTTEKEASGNAVQQMGDNYCI